MVTMSKLNSALSEVQDELMQLHFYDSKLEAVDVYLVLIGGAYGWKYDGKKGNIHIPSISLSKFSELFGWTGYTSLSDVMRHEFGHAFADTHKGLIRCSQFKEVFGSGYESKTAYEYDYRFFVSKYAAKKAAEDFAETFMYYVRYMGVLPNKFRTATIRRKWGFIKRLSVAAKKGLTRWN